MSAENEEKPPVAKIYQEPEEPVEYWKYVAFFGGVVLVYTYIANTYGREVAVESIGIWFICGAIAAAIGNTKGQAGNGLLLGVILGPIGIAIAVIMKGNREPCPYCKEKIVNTATVCIHCKKELDAGWGQRPGGT